MALVVMSFLAVAAMVIVYAWLGQGGAVAGLILFGGLLAAVLIRLAISAPSDS
jgi:prepilin signal peptidase PulO-like enzyme (type II secretory pathway)